MRQLEGIHIYWSFKLKGAAILLFYTPFRRHKRKQLSSGFSVNRPYSSPISLYNKSPLGPPIVRILMNITTVFCNCASPFCSVKFFYLNNGSKSIFRFYFSSVTTHARCHARRKVQLVLQEPREPLEYRGFPLPREFPGVTEETA